MKRHADLCESFKCCVYQLLVQCNNFETSVWMVRLKVAIDVKSILLLVLLLFITPKQYHIQRKHKTQT